MDPLYYLICSEDELKLNIYEKESLDIYDYPL
jgi:hypothetical protein